MVNLVVLLRQMPRSLKIIKFLSEKWKVGKTRDRGQVTNRTPDAAEKGTKAR